MPNGLSVIRKQSSAVALCVHPFIILEAGTETVEDYLKLGRKAEISLVNFQQVLKK